MFHHQGRNGYHSSEKHGSRDSGLVLSTDAKPRLKWTPDLHQRFIEAVNQLGGAERATPKSVLKLMGIQGLTLYHLKSHLQKFRLSKNNQANSTSAKPGRQVETRATIPNTATPQAKDVRLGEAIQMQIEVQQQLHEQLEIQRHLQLRIEAQGKYLHSVLEKAQETLRRQKMGTLDVEAAKAQLSELVSNVSNQSLNSMKELQDICLQQNKTNFLKDSSTESCLTTRDRSVGDQEMLFNTQVASHPIFLREKKEHENIGSQLVRELRWHEYHNECRDYPSSANLNMGIDFLNKHNQQHMSTSKGLSAEKQDRSRNRIEEVFKGHEQEMQKHKTLSEMKLAMFSRALDLNVQDESDPDIRIRCRSLDLNRYSCS